ncbi:MAG: acetolactate synthase small subunit [Candidatus Ornithospirochaeta sp.]|nr:acetolactate synthase small subunit [Candidatus Ornithospirochaeta sp.]
METNESGSYALAILVNNKPGILMRVVALFSRRGYNIDSLSVSETESHERSRITIVVSGNRMIVEQIVRQVEKLVDVIRVYEMTSSGSLQRELMMVKIKADDSTRSKIVELGDIFKSKVLDVTPTTVTLQVTGPLDKLESFLELARPYGIVELVRTGITALERGARPLSEITYED